MRNQATLGAQGGTSRAPLPYYRAAKVLAAADPAWLEQLITRRSRPEQAQQALQRTPDDIKVVIEFDQS